MLEGTNYYCVHIAIILILVAIILLLLWLYRRIQIERRQMEGQQDAEWWLQEMCSHHQKKQHNKYCYCKKERQK
jgi:hypothetical protein